MFQVFKWLVIRSTLYFIDKSLSDCCMVHLNTRQEVHIFVTKLSEFKVWQSTWLFTTPILDTKKMVFGMFLDFRCLFFCIPRYLKQVLSHFLTLYFSCKSRWAARVSHRDPKKFLRSTQGIPEPVRDDSRRGTGCGCSQKPARDQSRERGSSPKRYEASFQKKRHKLGSSGSDTKIGTSRKRKRRGKNQTSANNLTGYRYSKITR